MAITKLFCPESWLMIEYVIAFPQMEEVRR